MRGSIEDRLPKAEQRFRHRIRGVHRYSDDKPQGLIAVLRQAEAGEDVDPDQKEWATDLMHREAFLP